MFPDSKAVASTLSIKCSCFTEFEICAFSDLKKHCQFEGLPIFTAEWQKLLLPENNLT